VSENRAMSVERIVTSSGAAEVLPESFVEM
jgi:hypothetical protein